MSNELKPCPFCGETEHLEIVKLEDSMHPRQYEVVCAMDSGGCGGSAGYRSSKQDAIDVWNTRYERTCKFIEVGDDYDEIYAQVYKCSNCGVENIGTAFFCPNCGAKIVSE